MTQYARDQDVVRMHPLETYDHDTVRVGHAGTTVVLEPGKGHIYWNLGVMIPLLPPWSVNNVGTRSLSLPYMTSQQSRPLSSSSNHGQAID